MQWGRFSNAENIIINVEEYLEYHGMFSMVGDTLSIEGDVQYHGGYHNKCGGYLEYCVGVQ